MVGFPSGQRGQTVNLLRKLQRFESSPHHFKGLAFQQGLFYFPHAHPSPLQKKIASRLNSLQSENDFYISPLSTEQPKVNIQ